MKGHVQGLLRDLSRLGGAERHCRAILWILLFLTPLFVATFCIATPYFRSASYLRWPISIGGGVGALALGFYCGIAAWAYLRKRLPYARPNEVFDALGSEHVRPSLYGGTVFAIALTLACFVGFLLLVWFCGGQPLDDGTKWDIPKSLVGFWMNSPGGVFAVLTGIATLIATYLTLHSVFEFRHTITSFPQLVKRAAELIEEATDQKEEVRIFCYSPLPGAFNSSVGPRLTRRLRDALIRPDSRISIACLDPSSHLHWIRHFPPYAVSSDGDAAKHASNRNDRFAKECECILQVIGGQAYQHDLADDSPPIMKTTRGSSTPIRLKWSEMPGYYFFASPKRAIVVVPVKMPRIGNPSPAGLGVGVDTLGFETTDDRVIHMLVTEFDRYCSVEFVHGDICDIAKFVDRLASRSRKIDAFLWDGISQNGRDVISALLKKNDPESVILAEFEMRAQLNRILRDSKTIDSSLVDGFERSKMTEFVQGLCEKTPPREKTDVYYRLLLCDAYPEHIAPHPYTGHLRKADDFEWTPSPCEFVVN